MNPYWTTLVRLHFRFLCFSFQNVKLKLCFVILFFRCSILDKEACTFLHHQSFHYLDLSTFEKCSLHYLNILSILLKVFLPFHIKGLVQEYCSILFFRKYHLELTLWQFSQYLPLSLKTKQYHQKTILHQCQWHQIKSTNLKFPPTFDKKQPIMYSDHAWIYNH